MVYIIPLVYFRATVRTFHKKLSPGTAPAMPLLPDLPDAIQRLIAEHVLDLRVEASAGRILCEQLDDVWRRGGPRCAVATARGWLRGDDVLLWRGRTTAHGLPRITAAQRRNVAALAREPWRETYPYCFAPLLRRGDDRLDMLDDMNGFGAYCQAALPWGRAGAVRFVYGWSRATLVERRVPVCRGGVSRRAAGGSRDARAGRGRGLRRQGGATARGHAGRRDRARRSTGGGARGPHCIVGAASLKKSTSYLAHARVLLAPVAGPRLRLALSSSRSARHRFFVPVASARAATAVFASSHSRNF